MPKKYISVSHVLGIVKVSLPMHLNTSNEGGNSTVWPTYNIYVLG